jgi:hypothetical protein
MTSRPVIIFFTFLIHFLIMAAAIFNQISVSQKFHFFPVFSMVGSIHNSIIHKFPIFSMAGAIHNSQIHHIRRDMIKVHKFPVFSMAGAIHVLFHKFKVFT